MGIITIEEMEFYAYHGHFKEEQIVGNRFLVDLVLEVETDAASKSDDLHDAVNYQTAYFIVKEEMKQKSHLLEHIAGRILDSIYLKLPGVKKATVKVRKMNPPMGGQMKSVGVTLTRLKCID